MNNTLANIWLFATHWTKLDAFDTEEELNDELELLQRQSLPTRRAKRSWCSTSNRPTAITPATAPAGGPAG